MRTFAFTISLVAATLTSAASITCDYTFFRAGWLSAVNNGPDGQVIPLWIDYDTRQLVTSSDTTNGVWVYPCQSAAIGQPAMTIYGQLQPWEWPTTLEGGCLTRSYVDGSVGLAPCETEDTLERQETQFWHVVMNWEGAPQSGNATEVAFVKPGLYGDLVDSQWYGAYASWSLFFKRAQ
ncbi:hypothetical protein BKA62DRAFT_710289 [Auriculariales sp. MPI-PUGE-AT-0066]|nr:hypothetical protein BKA62DRAFT_710289 [Auriculariales sp. MPI-PUGE-AT-0066]